MCTDRPFYYTVIVENWGEDTAEDVTVQDTLSSQVEYVPGTTEINKYDSWESIPDGDGGVFPLTQPYKIAAEMKPCLGACEDSFMIRFKVQPKEDLPKHVFVENTAIISDKLGASYRTNTSIPVRTKFGSCPAIEDCPEPPLAECGGEGGTSSSGSGSGSSSSSGSGSSSSGSDSPDSTHPNGTDSDIEDDSDQNGEWVDFGDEDGCSCSVAF